MGEVDLALLPESYNEKKKKSGGVWKWIVKVSLWGVFICWIILFFLLPVESFHLAYEEWVALGGGTLWGIEGRSFLVYGLPILILALLALAYNILADSHSQAWEWEQLHLHSCSSEKPKYRLWTFPVLVDGAVGVVSAAEVIGILIFLFYLIWAFLQFNIRNIQEASGSSNEVFFLSYLLGICFGEMGRSVMAFLFLPVARGSALLRLINVPFEHATKYHIWIGNLTVLIFTLHGIAMTIAYAAEGNIFGLFTWSNYGGANLPGVIALFIGFLMWITSIHPIRNTYFRTFFYTHQLYTLFLIFFALHVGDFFYAMAAGGIFIFMLDRFLRFIQSRSTTDIVSAKYFPCGVVQLALSKPPNLRYNALSFVFLQIRQVSWLQWHPFSISSSPLDGKDHLSVMIKVRGQWTAKLKHKMLSKHFNLTASVEGPYGYELPYYIEYKKLVLVAGGIGISPFLAILSDILYRIRQGKPCLPRNILLVWAVKKSNEIALMESLCPSFSNKLNIDIHIYVTQESKPSMALEEGNVYDSFEFSRSGGRISNLVGTGNNKWLLAYLLSSSIGFVIIKAALNTYYVNALDVRAWWYKGTLLVACMVAAVVIFGGIVIALWHLWETKILVSPHQMCNDSEEEVEDLLFIKDNTSIHYGSRPVFQEILGRLEEQWGHVDVGVIVCGPSSLETSVARECRTSNVRRESHGPIFHFHTHSFSF